MNILILGSGGREHALAWIINKSKQANKIFIAPGNGGTSEIGKNIALDPENFDEVAEFITKNSIELCVVGPEAPLVKGIVDYFKSKKQFETLKIIGPSKTAAQLEGSKEYAKEFMFRHGIPTAKYLAFTQSNLEEGYQFLESLKSPYVLKADGLAAGKGVLIINDLETAKAELKSMLKDKRFGEASKTVVIEEFLSGIEMSVFVLTDGKNYKILPEAKDYKRIGEGDTGLNTGGMGAVSPVPFASKQLMDKIEKEVIIPSVKGIEKEALDYKGFLFIGLMIQDNQPYVIEYNVRLGDPETEVILPRIESDFLSHLLACSDGTLDKESIKISKQAATTVMLVSQGYPESYEKGKEINGFENLGDCQVFHAGTNKVEGKVLSNAITALDENYKSALVKVYRNVERIQFEGKNFRKDIGFDLMIEEAK